MKRSKTYDGGTSKRIKGDGNLDELWGDDLDVQDVDDCFKLINENLAEANFTCTQRNNVSIVPSYNIFKTDKLNATSTSTQIAQAGTSKNVAGRSESTFKRHHSFESSTSEHPLESKVKKLKETCMAKDGEVNILRSHIVELKKGREKEHEKVQNEWTDKFKEVMTKLNEVTSELEFKNLEIVNLKQKFDVLKVTGSSQPSTSNQSHVSEEKTEEKDESSNDDDDDDEVLNMILPEDDYELERQHERPLEYIFPACMFGFVHRETFMMEFEEADDEYKYKMPRHPISYLNLDVQQYYSKVEEVESKVTYLKSGRVLSFGYLHSDLFTMTKFSMKELQSVENHCYFNNLVCTSEQLMDNLYQYLVTVKRGMLKFKELRDNEQKKDPVVVDLNLSPFDSKHWYYNELGISARQGIACITEMLPFCSYIRNYMLLNGNLIFSEKDDHIMNFPVVQKQNESNYSNKHNFLELIRLAVIIIKRLKLERYSSGFLCSVIGLINQSCTFAEIEESTEIYLYDLAFLMCTGKSTPNTCINLLEYVRRVSNKRVFVEKLCKFPEHKRSCVLHPFFEMLETFLFKVEDLNIKVPLLDLITFSLNVLTINPVWLSNSEYLGCTCLEKFITTTVDVIYRTIKKFDSNIICGLIVDKFYDNNLLSKCISLMHLLASKCYTLLVKCVHSFSQYNDILQVTIDMKEYFEAEQQENISTLESLVHHEELPPLDTSKLDNCEVWKRPILKWSKSLTDFISANTEYVFLPNSPSTPEFRLPSPEL